MATNRLSMIITLVGVAALAVFTISMVAPPRTPAYNRAYDQIEFVRAQRYASAAAQQAYLDQRRGEWTASRAVDPKLYFPLPPGKQTILANATAAYLDYRRR